MIPSIRSLGPSVVRKALVLGALLAPFALPAEAAPGVPRPDTAALADVTPVNYGYGYGHRRGYRPPPPPPPYYHHRRVYGYGYGYPPPRPRHYGYYGPRYYR